MQLVTREKENPFEVSVSCHFSGVGWGHWRIVSWAANLWSGSSRRAWLQTSVRLSSTARACCKAAFYSTSSRNAPSKTRPFFTPLWPLRRHAASTFDFDAILKTGLLINMSSLRSVHETASAQPRSYYSGGPARDVAYSPGGATSDSRWFLKCKWDDIGGGGNDHFFIRCN